MINAELWCFFDRNNLTHRFAVPPPQRGGYFLSFLLGARGLRRRPTAGAAGLVFLFCGDQVIIYRLTAVEQIHICVRANLSENIRRLLGLLFRNVRAVIDGDVALV